MVPSAQTAATASTPITAGTRAATRSMYCVDAAVPWVATTTVDTITSSSGATATYWPLGAAYGSTVTRCGKLRT